MLLQLNIVCKISNCNLLICTNSLIPVGKNNRYGHPNKKALHHLILEDIESFMKELGNSFSFIGSEYKIKIGDRSQVYCRIYRTSLNVY